MLDGITEVDSSGWLKDVELGMKEKEERERREIDWRSRLILLSKVTRRNAVV